MTTTPPTNPTEVDIMRLYIECDRDLEKVAERLGMPYSDFVTRHGAALAPPVRSNRRRVPPADLGQNPNLRKHIVSVRHADAPVWPTEDREKIEAARSKYEAGTHEISQGRDRNWFIMYCTPRSVRTAPRKFFVTHD